MAQSYFINPFSQFNDPSSSKPVGQGLLYIGEIDKDPQDFPITVSVVQPDGTTLEVSQPLSLSVGGNIIYEGNPVQLSIAETRVSVKVLNAGNQVVYYAARFSPAANAEDVRIKFEGLSIASLYDYGGQFEGDCIEAMNLAMADNNVSVIIVPDNVILGRHVFDCAIPKKIVGGKNVTFTGVSCGLYPRVCEYIEIDGFRDAILPAFIEGTTPDLGAIFCATASGHDIGTIIISNNVTSGGRIGVAVGPEGGSGDIRYLALIENNTFKNNNGIVGGTGYGIQYANENEYGTCTIRLNTVIESSRNGIYVARNQGTSPVLVYGNKVFDHRKNASNKGAGVFPSFNMVRGSNIHGWSNVSVRPYDGSLLITSEEEPPFTLKSFNVTWRDFTVDSPRNSAAQIYVGYIYTPTETSIESVIVDGVNYICVDTYAPLIEYNHGKNINFRNLQCSYFNITRDVIIPVFLNGRTEINSGGVNIDNMNVVLDNCIVSVAFAAFFLGNNYCLNQLPLFVNSVNWELRNGATATVEKAFEFEVAATNTEIEVWRCSDSGMVFSSGVTVKKSEIPSLPYAGRINATGISTPNGVFTPRFIGDEIILTDDESVWKAVGLNNTDWIETSNGDFAGDNANGRYVQFDNGVLIQHFAITAGNVSTALGSIFKSADATWTFPIPFLAGTTPRVTATAFTPDMWVLGGGTASTTEATVRAAAAVSSGTCQINLIAVGVWK